MSKLKKNMTWVIIYKIDGFHENNCLPFASHSEFLKSDKNDSVRMGETVTCAVCVCC